MIVGFLLMFFLVFGGWIVWGLGQGIRGTHMRALAREREETERLRLRLAARDREQERADRIYFDTVERNMGPLSTSETEARPDNEPETGGWTP